MTKSFHGLNFVVAEFAGVMRLHCWSRKGEEVKRWSRMESSHFLCISWSVSDTHFSEAMELDTLKLVSRKAADIVVSFERTCWM